MIKKTILATLTVAGLGLNLPAYATQTDTTINPSLVLEDSCSIDTGALIVDFGTHATGATYNNQSAGSLSVTCNAGVSYAIGFNGGLQSTSSARYLTSGTYSFIYGIYSNGSLVGDGGLNAIDPGYTEVFAVNQSLTGTGSGTYPITFSFASADAPAGSYSDTVTITVVW